ncbi:MAG: hypothetical protein QOD02_2711 [Mycobacterium sp.]|jgi:hypothetical protein|nr:hypothetical protein [Mycobacterium sp.]
MSTLDATDFLRFRPEVFYDPDMALPDSDAVGTDLILSHIDAEAGSVSIEVTLYLPWGVATGITVPSEYFGHYVGKFFTRNDAEDVAGRIGALEAEQKGVFLHLRKARCYVAGTVVEHDSLRIRLSDISAWTVAGIKRPSAEPSLVS